MRTEPRLLVVDDEEVVCKSCRRIFEGQGYKVESSTDSTEGLSKATTNSYDAILLDIKMPKMDGLEFLEKFRETRPDVPVIMITGYSSVPTAAQAMRLGAIDYIPKPFSPKEISEAVSRLLSVQTTVAAPIPVMQTEVAVADKPSTSYGTLTEDVLFLDDSWVQVGEDGSVRVGGFISPEMGAKVKSMRMPKQGDKVQHGLPLVAFKLDDGMTHVVPAPVSGDVMEINEALVAKPELAWTDPCHKGWVARLMPSRLAADLKDVDPREVVLSNADAGRAAEQARAMSLLGCKVHVAPTVADTLEITKALANPVVLLDGQSLADKGPEVVKKLNAMKPAAKIVVAASPEASWEKDYRANKIFYYAVEPFADGEVIDILHAAFRPAERVTASKHEAAGVPSWIRRIRVTNRQGETVTLLTSAGLLSESSGLGRELVSRALDGVYPVRVTLGRDGLNPMEIRQVAGDADRILVMEVRDMGGLPGALSRKEASEVVEAAGEAAQKVTTFTVQPAAGPEAMGFDARSTAALAEAILNEMVSV